MASHLDPPLFPKNGDTLRILAPCRISTVNQDEKSLDDQEAEYRRRVDTWTACPYDMTILASQGSGENLERADYLKAIELVETGEFDLVIVEDMGRLCRRVHAHIFAELCEDHNTRLIALNDHIDTTKGDWRLSSYFAVMRHETYNRDTSARIRRTLRNRFSQGGVFQFVLFGYVKKAGGSTEADVSKEPAAERIYKEWFRMLENGGTYAEVADWLNEQEISPGPFSRIEKWTGAMVARVTHNPILKGMRVRNKKMSRRINKSGRHVSVNAPPEEKLERCVPHLAFIDAERYDRVITLLKARNDCFKRKGVNGIDQRKNLPKKRTVWPGQHLQCGVCHRPFYWYGVGANKLMKCSGNQHYQCWNGVEVNGQIAATKLAEAIFREIMALPGFDAAILEEARQQWRQIHCNYEAREKELQRRRSEVDRQITNVTEAIATTGIMRSLQDKLRKLEQEREALDLDMAQLASSLLPEPAFPNLDVIKQKAKEVFSKFAPEDPEIGRLMHILVPVLNVVPMKLCDGGAITLRARARLNLAAFMNNPLDGLTPQVFCREIFVDLFEPPQREEYRQQVVRMRATGLTEQEVADHLGITKTAAQRAAALQRKMDELRLTDPYIPIQEPTSEGGLRRHLHPRFKFEPLDQGSSEIY